MIISSFFLQLCLIFLLVLRTSQTIEEGAAGTIAKPVHPPHHHLPNHHPQNHSHNPHNPHNPHSSHNRNHHQKSPKIAFLFLCRLNLPLIEIWEEFFSFHASPNLYNLYVLSVGGYHFPKESVFYNRTINRPIASGWGSITQVQAIRSLFQEALQDDPSNQFFAVLSESCLPLYSFAKIYRILTTSPHPKSVVNACPFTSFGGMEITRWKASLESSPTMKRDFWRKSATWVMLIRPHATIFAQSASEDQYWVQIPCVDEHYLPSILASHGVDSNNETTCSDGFTHVYWRSQIDAHPYTYPNEEISEDLFHHLRYHKVIEYHHHPERATIDFNHLCSGYDGICHFAARKFGFLSKFHLLTKLSQLLVDDRDDIFYNPYPPPASPWMANYSDYFQASGSQNYPGYDFQGKLFKRLRRKRPEPGTVENFGELQEIYYLDHVHLRVFPDLETMRFYLHLPLIANETETRNELMAIPYLTEEEAQRHLKSQFSQFYPIRQKLLLKVRRKNAVWIIDGYVRRVLPNWDTLTAMNIGTNIVTIGDFQLEEIPVGPPIPPIST